MMKLSRLTGAFLAACILFTACEDKKNQDSKILTIGTCADYAPFEFFKEGEIAGFDIDLMKEIAKRLNKEVIFKDMSFESLLGALSANRIEGAISALSSTEERRKSIDFTTDYLQSAHVMICAGSSAIETTEDLTNQSIGVQSGSIHETYAKKQLAEESQLTIESLAKLPDLVQRMHTGQISCLVLGESEAGAILKTQNNLKSPLKIVSLPGEKGGYAIALPKGSPLRESINKILAEMEADGSLAELKKKWLEIS